MQIMKIVISRFRIQFKMQKLEKVIVKIMCAIDHVCH